MNLNPKEYPHRRLNPLTGEWVLVSPHRTKRPWQGQVEKATLDDRPSYDPNCYLCPRNNRAGGVRNPDYKETFVFTNDFSALLPETPQVDKTQHPLFRSLSVEGTCRVMCFSPRHDLTIPEMEIYAIQKIVDMWVTQTNELGKIYKWVQVFENKGAVMGCSNPHPHGQVWAQNVLPNEPSKEEFHQRTYFDQNRSPLLLDYAHHETKDGTRTIAENSDWIAVVPFWAVWPFETLLLPKVHITKFADLSKQQKDSLAKILKELLTKYDNLFETSFPYSMGWHGAPYTQSGDSHWLLHAHFYPPLLRSATVKKFMVGYEMMAEAQRDITAEQAAEQLRTLPNIHYKLRG